MIWGTFSLLLVIASLGFVFYALEWGNQPKIDKVSVNDVQFVLNWCDLGKHRIEKVEKSYVSARSFTGDHLDAYALQISPVESSELTQNTINGSRRWYRGDELPETLKIAVETVSWFHREIPWFPTVDELKSAAYYVSPWSIGFHGLRPDIIEIIFIRPADSRVFYISSKI